MYSYSIFPNLMVKDVKLCNSTETEQSGFCLSFERSDGITIPLLEITSSFK